MLTPKPSRTELEALTKDQLIDLILHLYDVINSLERRIAVLEEALTKVTSKNSSLAPSMDLSRKRKKGNNAHKMGPPPKHSGTSRTLTATPDVVLKVPIKECPRTHKAILSNSQSFKRHQIIELEPARVLVIEIQRQITTGPDGKTVVAPNPEGIHGYQRFGPNLKTQISYMRYIQNVPWPKIWGYLRDVVGLKVGQGTLRAIFNELSEELTAEYEQLKADVRKSKQVGCDETGFHVNGNKWWVHVAQTSDTTVFIADKSRRHEVIQDVLGESYDGWMIADFWNGYGKKFYPEAKFQRCMAHLLRDLEKAVEIERNRRTTYAKELYNVFFEAILVKKFFLPDTKEYHIEVKEKEERLDWLLSDNVEPKTLLSKRLKKRLIKHRSELFRFLYEESLPFDNNASEREIRSIVVCRKISGSYRTSDGLKSLASIKSIIATYAKRGKPILSAIQQAFGTFKYQPG